MVPEVFESVFLFLAGGINKVSIQATDVNGLGVFLIYIRAVYFSAFMRLNRFAEPKVLLGYEAFKSLKVLYQIVV